MALDAHYTSDVQQSSQVYFSCTLFKSVANSQCFQSKFDFVSLFASVICKLFLSPHTQKLAQTSLSNNLIAWKLSFT